MCGCYMGLMVLCFLWPLNEFNKTFHFLTIESADEAISVF